MENPTTDRREHHLILQFLAFALQLIELSPPGALGPVTSLAVLQTRQMPLDARILGFVERGTVRSGAFKESQQIRPASGRRLERGVVGRSGGA